MERDDQPGNIDCRVAGVRGKLRSRLDAEILNVSLTGVALETTSRLALDRWYSITLRCGHARLAVPARVARCTLRRTRPDPGGDPVPIYETGLEFGGVLGGRAGKVMRFVEDSAALGPGFRVVDRFPLAEGAPAQVEVDYPFRVQRIGPSGMWVDAEAVPEPGEVYPLEVRHGRAVLKATGRVVHRLPPGQDDAATRCEIRFAGGTPGHRRERFLARIRARVGGSLPVGGAPLQTSGFSASETRRRNSGR